MLHSILMLRLRVWFFLGGLVVGASNCIPLVHGLNNNNVRIDSKEQTTARRATRSATASYLNIPIPHSLFLSDGGYNHSLAFFGWKSQQPEGRLMIPLLYRLNVSNSIYRYLDDRTLCLRMGNTTTTTTTTTTTNSSNNNSNNSNASFLSSIATSSLVASSSPFALLVGAGGDCTYVTKVRHAQQLGAAAVLIAHDQCLCQESNCTTSDHDHDCKKNINTTGTSLALSDTDTTTCSTHLPFVVDDGSGNDITIPSMILAKSQADKIKSIMSTATTERQEQPILVEFIWSNTLPKKEYAAVANVTLDIWYNPLDHKANAIILNLIHLVPYFVQDKHKHKHKHKHKQEKQQLVLQFHSALINGTRFNCHHTPQQGNCKDMCTNQGRYCSTTNDYGDDNNNNNYNNNTITGADVVLEILRRKCIQQNNAPQQVLDYLQYFIQHCQTTTSAAAATFTDEVCIQEALKTSLLDKHHIELCLEESGDPNQDVINVWLEEELISIRDHGIVQTPTIWMNQRPFVVSSSGFFLQQLLQTICQQLDSSSAAAAVLPKICYECIDCHDPLTCASQKPMSCPTTYHADDDPSEQDQPSKKRSSRGRGWKWFFFVVILAAAGFGYIYNYTNILSQGGRIMETFSLQDALMSSSTT